MALVAYQDRSPEDQDTLLGYLIPYFAISTQYKPGAKMALVTYQDRSLEDQDTLSGYLIPYFAISTQENLVIKWP